MKIEDARTLTYAELVALSRELNRPSGGAATVQELAAAACVPQHARILEIGATTGFSSTTLAEITGANVTGVDIELRALALARERATRRGIANVEFTTGDATALTFDDRTFHLVWASNVPSFTADRSTALRECVRVCRLNGAIALVPIYYTSAPSPDLRDTVEELVGAPLPAWGLVDWIDALQRAAEAVGRVAELTHLTRHRYIDVSDRLDDWCRARTAAIVASLPEDVANAVVERYRFAIATFNENLRHCEYARMLFRVDDADDHQPELFLSEAAPS